jgi:ketosteroid isomerase-like protein
MRLIHRTLTETEARQFAQHWVLAWNSHDLDAIMAHYGWEAVSSFFVPHVGIRTQQPQPSFNGALLKWSFLGNGARHQTRFLL